MQTLIACIAVASIVLVIALAGLVSSAYAVRSFGDPIGYSESKIIVVQSPADENNENETEMPCELANPYMKEILVRDLQGNVIAETTVGSQVIIEAIVSNNCESRDEQTLWALFEVRDSRGITNYLSWQVGTIELNKQTIIGNSWVAPNMPGKYEVRGFSIGCLQCPMILSNVLTYELTVLPIS